MCELLRLLEDLEEIAKLRFVAEKDLNREAKREVVQLYEILEIGTDERSGFDS
jgi:hypothetical protein